MFSLRSKDRIRKSGVFLSPQAQIKKKRLKNELRFSKGELHPNLLGKWLDSPASSPPSLQDVVLNCFPDARPRDLQKWMGNVGKKASVLPEALLFITFLCGIHFRLFHPDISDVQGRLWKWLTRYPQEMDHELAEILIDALTPNLERTLKQGGIRRGVSDGEKFQIKGRPPEGRGAWVAAVAVEKAVIKSGEKKEIAIQIGAQLARLLLARKSSPEKSDQLAEYYRIRKRLGQRNAEVLADSLLEQYEYFLLEDGRTQNRIPPNKSEAAAYEKWVQDHKHLQELIITFTPDGFAKHALGLIPKDLWRPFWGSLTNN